MFVGSSTAGHDRQPTDQDRVVPHGLGPLQADRGIWIRGSSPFSPRRQSKRLVEDAAALVGIDSANMDDTRGGARPAHTGLLGAGIPIVEHLTDLARLMGRAFRFSAVPVPVRGLGTFPVRAFALLE